MLGSLTGWFVQKLDPKIHSKMDGSKQKQKLDSKIHCKMNGSEQKQSLVSTAHEICEQYIQFDFEKVSNKKHTNPNIGMSSSWAVGSDV